MAEGLLKKLLPAENGWRIASAGVFAGAGFPVSPNAVAALKEKGIDISAHRSQPLTEKLISGADLLIAMTRGHLDSILQLAPQSSGKVFLLKSFGSAELAADIDDPAGEALGVYRHVRDEIDAALPDLIIYMLEERK